jgi:hypothetical protein
MNEAAAVLAAWTAIILAGLTITILAIYPVCLVALVAYELFLRPLVTGQMFRSLRELQQDLRRRSAR